MSNEKIEDLKQKAVAGTLWNFVSTILTKLASMVVQLVLARLLLPEEFGTVALLNIFINISSVLITTGFTTAIIQKKDLTETDKSSAHFMGLGISAILYVVIFFAAPYVAKFYNDPEITAVLRVYSVVLLFSGFRSVHNALISKELKFKATMWRGVLTVVVQGPVGIVLAYFGFGVWALVFSYIIGNVASAIYTGVVMPWKPKLLFSWKSVKEMFKFSSNVLISRIFDTVYTDIRALLIGKVYTTETLAYYDRANLIRGYVFDTTIGAISTVMLPVLSKVNDDVAKVKQGLRRIVRSNMYLSTPMRIGMIAVAQPMILFLLGNNWAASVPFLQLICVTNLLAPTMNRTNAYLAMGRSDLALRCQLFNKGLILLCIFATVRFSVYMVVLSALVGNLISFVTGLFVNKKHLHYTIREQLADILPSVLLSVVMGIPVYLLALLPVAPILRLLIQTITGVGLYVGMSILVKYETFYYLKAIFSNMLRKGKKET